MDNSKAVRRKVKGVEYKHRDVRVSTSAGDLASDCSQSEKDLCREENNAESESM